MSEIQGHVAIVTGGGQGIGREIALQLVAAGAAVALTGRTAATIGTSARPKRANLPKVFIPKRR